MKVPWMKCLENQGTLPRQTTSGGEIPKKEKSTRWRHAWNSLRKFRLRKRRKGTTKEDDPQNGVVSQRSTLSSSCSSSPSVASLHGDIKGVWSPGQKSAEEKPKEVAERQQGEDEPIPSVWQPRSAGASPTAERKEFKPVSFDSPTLRRKNQPAEKESNASEEPPPTQRQWTTPSSASEVGTSLSSILERRLPTSHSAPSTGFSELTSSRLPRAQNPTITLLQKARAYHTKDDSNPERQKKMADLNPARYERGIGPVAKDGMPLVLRSVCQNYSTLTGL
ncbi:hypothetical protein PPYR_06797 [Photinus pyralis]|uniref:Uncharacterized protein n=1 Tax=Photinus pyralis TaxID=7054 RepID=A0A5N4ANK9_PHOPY|nr:hypothetical protein PPYR_06797 [Photinus pyralis]